MGNPAIIGRFGNDETANRTSTEPATEVSVLFCIICEGEVKVSIFKRTDSDGGGGFVLQLTMDKQDSGFQPFSKNITDGVELHVAGEIEAMLVISALKKALSSL